MADANETGRGIRVAFVATALGVVVLLVLLFTGVVGSSTTIWTQQILDSRDQRPLAGVRVSGRVYDERLHLGLGAGATTLFTWDRVTNGQGVISIEVPSYGSPVVEAAALPGYLVLPNVENEAVLRDPARSGKVRYLTPWVDINYEAVRYSYYMARQQVRGPMPMGDPAWVWVHYFREAQASVHVDRERTALLAFCREAAIVRSAQTESFSEIDKDALSSLLETCAPFVEATSTGGQVTRISGYVADKDGIDPIPGAVVSVTWHRPVGDVTNTGSPFTRVTRQARTRVDGHFEVEAPDLSVEGANNPIALGLPAELKVYALGHDITNIEASDLHWQAVGREGVSPAMRQLKGLVKISPARLESPRLEEQVTSWLDDLIHAIGEDGQAGAVSDQREGFKPLLELISEACTIIERREDRPVGACQSARSEFSITVPTRVLAVLYVPPPVVPLVRPAATRPVVISGPARSSLEAMTQAPPSK